MFSYTLLEKCICSLNTKTLYVKGGARFYYDLPNNTYLGRIFLCYFNEPVIISNETKLLESLIEI